MKSYKYKFGNVIPWWNDDFKKLDFQYLPIKNTFDEDRWRKQGYEHVRLNGQTVTMISLMDDMPEYAKPFLDMFDWNHTSLNFYCQRTLDMFPLHYDSYITYRK